MRLRSRLVWALTPPIIRSVARVLWRLEVRFTDRFPEPPFVLAANHHSFLDPFLIGAVCRRPVRFVGLSDLSGHYRMVDFFLDAFQVIPVTRGKVPLRAMRESLRHLKAGGVIGLFPEGTRHDRFDPAKALPGAAWLAIRAQVPLVCVAVRGSEVVLGVENRLHRGRIDLVIGPALRGEGEGREAVDDLTRRWGEWVAATLR